NHAFCDSSMVRFTDFTLSNDGIVSETYTFADGSPSVSSPTGPFNVSHFYNKPGTWLATLSVVTNAGCNETYTDTVRTWQTPHPVISVTSAFCAGLVTFAGNLTTAIVDPITWAWDFGSGKTSKDQNPSVNLPAGNYTVKLQTSVPFGCKADTTSVITIHPLPEIKGPHLIETPVGIPVTLPFTYSGGVNNWVWTPTDHLDCSDCANPVATLVFNQSYQVTVTDSNSCKASDTIMVKTICNDKNYFIPNTFSPNGDGVNDYFYPRGSNLYNIQSLRVFNRWGQLVFERRNFPANAATMGWDGTFNGHPAPMDAYVYIAEVICNNAQVVALHGDVTLVR
ncbi:MAG: gliding motility-associated C-terminal domain-containing protein, partial [Bacteroidetes bacterium]|nr:gliding motility-associated C-terminal domain-containing protein [Bacteroidota bacterium]